MQVNDELRAELQRLIASKLGGSEVESLSIESIDVIENKREIRIVVKIKTKEGAADAATIADRYFGLTGKVREALGESWNEFFPIITPKFGQAA